MVQSRRAIPGLMRRTYIWLRTGCGLQEKDEER
jgi:hypothetical protein